MEGRALLRGKLVMAVLDAAMIFIAEARMKTGYFISHVEIIV